MNTKTLRATCPCGTTSEFDKDAFIQSDWCFFGSQNVIEDAGHSAYCPNCNTIRQAEFEPDGDEETVLNVVLSQVIYPPEFIDSPSPEELSKRIERVADDGLPILGQCVSCSADITVSHRVKGSDAPELGWVYYRCPECSERMPPGALQP